MDLVLERAKLIEAETLKLSASLQTKAGGGVVALLALFSAVVGARDTLFWRISTSWPWYILSVLLELVFFGLSGWSFFKAYTVSEYKIGPKISDNGKLNNLLASRPVPAKKTLLELLQRDVKSNEENNTKLQTLVNWGFGWLAVLVLILGVHTCLSATIRSEVERSEVAQKTAGSGGASDDGKAEAFKAWGKEFQLQPQSTIRWGGKDSDGP